MKGSIRSAFKSLSDSILKTSCPVFALSILCILFIGSYLAFPVNSTFLSSMLTVVLAGATVTYAHSAWRTLKVMQVSRIESFRPIIAIRFHDRNAVLRGFNVDGGGFNELVRAHMLKNTRYGLWLENIGKGPALNITVWSNLLFDESYKWTTEFNKEMLSPWPTPQAFAFPLGNDSTNLQTQIHFITAPEAILLRKEPVFLIQYVDVFGNLFITIHRDGCQRLMKIASPLREHPIVIDNLESKLGKQF